MKLPRDIGPVHFVGIGGIGMSGIAEVMVNLGYVVQGSDQAEGANVKRLREKGVTIAVETTTTSASPSAAAEWPIAIFAPLSRSRLTLALSEASEPCTR